MMSRGSALDHRRACLPRRGPTTDPTVALASCGASSRKSSPQRGQSGKSQTVVEVNGSLMGDLSSYLDPAEKAAVSGPHRFQSFAVDYRQEDN